MDAISHQPSTLSRHDRRLSWRMLHRPAVAFASLALASLVIDAPAAPSFAEAGVPFLQTHCVSCHGKEKQKADLAFHEVRDEVSLLRARRRWKEVLNMVQSGEM